MTTALGMHLVTERPEEGQLAFGESYETPDGLTITVRGVALDECDGGDDRASRLVLDVRVSNDAEESREFDNHLALTDERANGIRPLWVDPDTDPTALPGRVLLASGETLERRLTFATSAVSGRGQLTPAWATVIAPGGCTTCPDVPLFIAQARWQTFEIDGLPARDDGRESVTVPAALVAAAATEEAGTTTEDVPCPYCAMLEHLPVAVFFLRRADLCGHDPDAAEIYLRLATRKAATARALGTTDEVLQLPDGPELLAALDEIVTADGLSIRTREQRLLDLCDRLADLAEVRNQHRAPSATS